MTVSGYSKTNVDRLRLVFVDSEKKIKTKKKLQLDESGRFEGKIRFWSWDHGEFRLMARNSQRRWYVLERFKV